jgi:hypothetical protein
MAVLHRANVSDTARRYHGAAESTKDGGKPDRVTGMLGAGLTAAQLGKALSEMPALEPYWGKPAVRNLRGTTETSAVLESRSAPSSYPTVRSLQPASTAFRARDHLGVAQHSASDDDYEARIPQPGLDRIQRRHPFGIAISVNRHQYYGSLLYLRAALGIGDSYQTPKDRYRR